MKSIKSWKTLRVNATTLETYKDKIPLQVSSLEKHKSGEVYRVTFKSLDKPGYIVDHNGKVRFIHFCEAAAGGASCTHIAFGYSIGELIGKSVEVVGSPSKVVDIAAELGLNEDFEDVSSLIGVIASTSSTTSSPTASSASPKVSSPAAPPIAAAKRDWKTDWADIQTHLASQGLTNRMIVIVRQRREEICNTVAMTTMATAPIKPNFPYVGSMLARSIRHILQGKDLILEGDKGSGKDTLVNTLAWIFGYPIYLQTGNGGETKESVVGENTLEQGSKGMEVLFKKTAFATAVESGGVSHYAELNMLPGDVTSLFHSVLDENRQLASQVGSIERHKHHLFIASINVGEQYTGVKHLNGALKDRVAVLKLPYVQDFRGMISSKTGLSDKGALDFLCSVKEAIDFLITTEGQGEESKTIRGYINAAEYLKEYGVNFDTKVEVLEDYILNRTEDREEFYALRDIIRQKAWKDLPMTKEEEDYINGAK